MKRSAKILVWQEVFWSRPFQLSDVLDFLTYIASLSPRKQIIWEIRGSEGKVQHYIGTGRRYMKPLKSAFSAHGKIEFTDIKERTEITSAKQLKISKPMLSIKTENTLTVLKTALSALANTKNDETMVLQIILGDSFAPSPAPDKAANPYATILDTICGNAGTASKESLTAIKNKTTQHGFNSMIRIGAKAETEHRENELLLSLMSALRQFETAGVKFAFYNTYPKLLNQAKMPRFLPLRLSVTELAGLVLLPCTNTDLPGIGGLHPKLIRPPFWFQDSSSRSFANSLGSIPKKLNIPIKDSLCHTVILGATGSGKSTVMLNLALEDIRCGNGLLLIDPKATLVNDILARIPKERTKDVIVVDPSDVDAPVGINPFVFSEQAEPCLISDTILSVFQQVFKDSWGVHSQDVLSASLLTLAQTKNATLLHLIPLLTDERVRHSIIRNIKDKYLQQFWASFDAMSKSERRQAIAPVMNKLRQFTMRPHLRNMLGQAKPKFSLSELFTKNKIILVQLNKGIIGADSAKLIGSMIVV